MGFFENIADLKLHITSTYITPFIFGKPKVPSCEETLDYLLSNPGTCVSRYGDGEFKVMMGMGNGFQNPDKKLKKRLCQIIKKNGNPKMMVCIPDFFDEGNYRTVEAKKFWLTFWRVFSFKICRRLNLKKLYFNAHLTRPYMDYEDKASKGKYFEKMKMLWDNRDILIIEGEKSRLGIGNDLFDNAKSIQRILCPAHSAFSRYDEILSSAKEYGKDKLIIAALGMTATVLSYDLFKEGYWCIDMGHIDIEYEWYKLGTTEKVALDGKFVKEVEEGTDVAEVEDEKYTSQIIKKIV